MESKTSTIKWLLNQLNFIKFQAELLTDTYIVVYLQILTDFPEVEPSSQGNMSYPCPRVDTYISRPERWDKQVLFDRVSVFVSWENLKTNINKPSISCKTREIGHKEGLM